MDKKYIGWETLMFTQKKKSDKERGTRQVFSIITYDFFRGRKIIDDNFLTTGKVRGFLRGN